MVPVPGASLGFLGNGSFAEIVLFESGVDFGFGERTGGQARRDILWLLDPKLVLDALLIELLAERMDLRWSGGGRLLSPREKRGTKGRQRAKGR